MFFKSVTALTFTVLLGLYLGCAGEDQPQMKIKDLRLGDNSSLGTGQCLEDFGGTLSKLVKSELAADELAQFVGCIENALKMFSTYVKGAQAGIYTADELRTYLQTYFMKDSKISDELLESVMELKQLFIGGSPANLTLSEVKKARDFVNFLGGLSYQALPYMKIYASGIGQGADLKTLPEPLVLASLDMFKTITQDLARWLKHRRPNYKFSQFVGFLQALKGSMTGEQGKALDDFIKMVPLAQSVKVVLLAGGPDEISGHQWDSFLKMLHKAFTILIRYHYSIKGEANWLQTGRFVHLNEIISTVFEMMEQGISVHAENIIPHTEVASVIEKIGEMVTFPLDLEASTIVKLWEALIDYGLKPVENDDRITRKTPGLGPDQLAVMRYEFQHWFAAQDYLNTLYFHGFEEPPPVFSTFKRNSPDRDSAIREIKRVISGTIPITLDDQSRVYLNSSHKDLTYDYNSLFALNWERACIRLLIKGFSKDQYSRENIIGLTETDLEGAAKSLKELLVALGIADDVDTPKDIASNIFQLASLFMPRSQGSTILSMEESVEYFSMVLSGVTSGQPLVDLTRVTCMEGDMKAQALPVSCFRNLFFFHFDQMVGNMPQMTDYFASLTDEKRVKFQKALEDATRPNGYTQEDISPAEINKIFVLLHYIEIYMWRFDKNIDNKIKKDEALAGFHVFKRILGGLLVDRVGFDSGTLTKGLYAWLLHKGKVPSDDETVTFALWSVTKWGWNNIKANRTRLAQILAALAIANP